MRVLIFEPDHLGHRLHYVRHIAEALSELPVEVVVVLNTQARASVEFAINLGGMTDRVRFDTSVPPLPVPPLQAARHAVRHLRAAIAEHRPDRLYVPYVDGLSQVLGLSRLAGRNGFSRPLVAEGLAFNGAFAYGGSGTKAGLKAKLSWAVAKRAGWDILHVLDPIVFEHIERSDPRFARRCRLMPDPVENTPHLDRVTARRSLGIPEDGRYLCLVGAIDRRKGADLLLRAFADAPLRSDDRILFAGRLHPEIRTLLAEERFDMLRRAGRIQCLDRYLEMNELSTAIGASDLMATLYPRHVGSASIAIRAAAGHRPVLAGEYGWLGLIVPRFELGWTTDVLDSARLPAVLAESLDKSNGYVTSPLTQRYVAYCSLPNFKAHWTAGLRQALGLPQSPDLRTWQSVSEGAT